MEKLKDEIMQNTDLTEIVADYVTLQKRGSNFWGLCPFHQEKTPSFTVNPQKQLYYCFGCGVGGNVINFVMAMENLPFKDVLAQLAERANIPYQFVDNKESQQEQKKREEIYKAHQLAYQFFQYVLFKSKKGAEGLDYLKKRGYSLKFAQKMGLGMAPTGWDHLFTFLKNKGFSAELLVEAGLILANKNNTNYYDRFRGRLIFTIFNPRNAPIAFGGRLLNNDTTQQPKYLNSPETSIFSKSRNLYGLNWAQKALAKENFCVIVEGYTDLLALHQQGLTNVLASLGTAFTKEQARLLKRYTSKIYVAFDDDAAGEKAAIRSMEILYREGLQVFIVKLVSGKDPDDFVNSYGVEAFQAQIKNAIAFHTFLIEQVIAQKDLNSSQGQIQAGQEVAVILTNIKDAIEREVYLKYASDRIGISQKVLAQAIDAEKRGPKRYSTESKKTQFNILEKGITLPSLEEKVMAVLIEGQPSELREQISDQDFENPQLQKLFQLLEQGENKQQLLSGSDQNIINLIAKLSNIKVNIKADDLIEEFLSNRHFFQKKELLQQLINNESIALRDLNELLAYYSDILEFQRGLRKEGYNGNR